MDGAKSLEKAPVSSSLYKLEFFIVRYEFLSFFKVEPQK